MTGLAEELPVATETGQLRSHPSGFRPLLPLGHLPDSDSNAADSCPTVTVTLEGCFPVGHLTPPQQNGYLPPRLEPLTKRSLSLCSQRLNLVNLCAVFLCRGNG